MTGRFAASLSNASNPFTDIHRCEYSDELLRLYGAERYRALLPDIATPSETIFLLSKRAAAELGIGQGTPVVMAPYDIVTTAFGCGAASPGQACLILGTTIRAETFTAGLDLGGELAGTTVALSRSMHLRAMPTLAGCETLEWAASMLGVTSGTFYGLKLSHGPSEMARAAYAGLSFAVRECLEVAAQDVTEVRVCGGGARSSFWCQMIADVTGLNVLRSAENEAGARGAYAFGLVATGAMPDIEKAAENTPADMDRFVPVLETQGRWQLEYSRFKLVRNAMRELWRPEKVLSL